MKSKLSEKDLELLQIKGNVNIDPTIPEYSYLFPRFDGGVDGNERDYVEAHIFDTSENFLESAVVNKEYVNKAEDNSIKIKTGTFLRKIGYDRGRYVVKYNFFRKLAGDHKPILVDAGGVIFNEAIDTGDGGNIVIQSDGRIFTKNKEQNIELFLRENKYFIHEISPSRKEVRLATQQIKNDKYLRDFFNLQRESKRIGSTGTDDSHLLFVPDQQGDGASAATSTTLKLANPNGNEFTKNLIGGVLEIPTAFVSHFEAKSQLGEPGLGGGPDEEYHDSEDASVFIPSFMWEVATEKTEIGTMMTPTQGIPNLKFILQKNRLKRDDIPDIDELIEMSANQMNDGSHKRVTLNPLRPIVSLGQRDMIQHEMNKIHTDLDGMFTGTPIRVRKNKKITLKSNSILRNIGRTYRWAISGVERTRIRKKVWGVTYKAYWSWKYITKEQVTIHAPNGGTVNGLVFIGHSANYPKPEGQELVFTINAEGCVLDILLEIELEDGTRFTEKIFIPRAIKSY
jgi:hypothetical protein